MKIIFLAIIYAVFFSLGLPDGVLGGSWPVLHSALGAPVALGGLLTVVSVLMTTVSSLMTARLVKAIGTGRLVAFSTVLTSVGILGLSQSHHIGTVFLFVIPMGLGAGAIDSALNHYMSVSYKAHHMNWLHACWGMGAMSGPLVFAAALGQHNNWRGGFLALGLMQAVVAVLVFGSMRMWSKAEKARPSGQPIVPARPAKVLTVLKKPRTQLASLIFLLYVGLEVVVGFWVASYLVHIQNLDVRLAAIATSVYYGAIMLGRLISGGLAFRISNRDLIRLGLFCALGGTVLLGMGISSNFSMLAILLIGLGFAPIYPSLIHLTPQIFGKNSSQAMSLQMAAGYLGAAILAPVIGLLANWLTFSVFIAVVILVLAVLLPLTHVSTRT